VAGSGPARTAVVAGPGVELTARPSSWPAPPRHASAGAGLIHQRHDTPAACTSACVATNPRCRVWGRQAMSRGSTSCAVAASIGRAMQIATAANRLTREYEPRTYDHAVTGAGYLR
jgi:hypothetical protein